MTADRDSALPDAPKVVKCASGRCASCDLIRKPDYDALLADYEALRETLQRLNAAMIEQLILAKSQELRRERDEERKALDGYQSHLTLGVGDGSGQLFVSGTYEAIKTCQSKILRMEAAEREAAALRETVEKARSIMKDALRSITYDTEQQAQMGSYGLPITVANGIHYWLAALTAAGSGTALCSTVNDPSHWNMDAGSGVSPEAPELNLSDLD